jgi:hypothetical protein
MGPYSKGLSQEKVVIESFDGNILEEISRVHIMAVNFPSGPHKMQVGLYRRAGELTAHPMGLTASFKFTALPYTIYEIDYIAPYNSIGDFKLYEIRKDKSKILLDSSKAIFKKIRLNRD